MHRLALSDNPDDSSGGGGSTVFHHNGDYSGDVDIVRGSYAREKCIRVPFWQIKRLVAEFVRAEKMRRIENATSDELLGLASGKEVQGIDAFPLD